MKVIRSVEERDLASLLELSHMTGYGLTTLPSDEAHLERRIRAARSAFGRRRDREANPGDAYLFVLEDLAARRVVGTCGIVSKVGGFDPFYAYRLETSVHASPTLGVRKEIKTLHLVAEHNGPCEIGSLFLAPEARRGGSGRLLSLARFLFMAETPDAFDPTVIAEMRGVIDASGRSVFWEAVGRHFFDVDFPTADYLSVVDKRFIADLMPTHPIYLPLLPEEARAVIGEVHPDTIPARQMLEREGFRDSGLVDIFEAGPVLVCPRDEIRALRDSEALEVVAIREHDSSEVGGDWIVARSMPFRACQSGDLEREDGGLVLHPEIASALEVAVGERVRVVRMRPDVAPRDAS